MSESMVKASAPDIFSKAEKLLELWRRAYLMGGPLCLDAAIWKDYDHSIAPELASALLRVRGVLEDLGSLGRSYMDSAEPKVAAAFFCSGGAIRQALSGASPSTETGQEQPR